MKASGSPHPKLLLYSVFSVHNNNSIFQYLRPRNPGIILDPLFFTPVSNPISDSLGCPPKTMRLTISHWFPWHHPLYSHHHLHRAQFITKLRKTCWSLNAMIFSLPSPVSQLLPLQSISAWQPTQFFENIIKSCQAEDGTFPVPPPFPRRSSLYYDFLMQSGCPSSRTMSWNPAFAHSLQPQMLTCSSLF